MVKTTEIARNPEIMIPAFIKQNSVSMGQKTELMTTEYDQRYQLVAQGQQVQLPPPRVIESNLSMSEMNSVQVTDNQIAAALQASG